MLRQRFSLTSCVLLALLVAGCSNNTGPTVQPDTGGSAASNSGVGSNSPGGNKKVETSTKDFTAKPQE